MGCGGSSDTRAPARTGGAPILPAGYEGYSGGSWHQLAAVSPRAAGYITLVFRMYGIYIVAFALLAVVIAATAFRRGDRWAWWALLVGQHRRVRFRDDLRQDCGGDRAVRVV